MHIVGKLVSSKMKFINIMCTEWTVCLNWCFNKSAQCESHTPMRTGVGRHMPPQRSKLPVTLVFLSFGLARRLAIWNYREGSYHNLVKIKHSIRNINIFTALFIQIIMLHLARLIFLKLAQLPELQGLGDVIYSTVRSSWGYLLWEHCFFWLQKK